MRGPTRLLCDATTLREGRGWGNPCPRRVVVEAWREMSDPAGSYAAHYCERHRDRTVSQEPRCVVRSVVREVENVSGRESGRALKLAGLLVDEVTMKQEHNTDRLPRLSPAASSRLLKKALRASFAGVKFSVKLSTGTAYGNVHVSWNGGPTGDEVREVARGFEGRGFDGRDNSTTFHKTEIDVDGAAYESGLGMILLYRSDFVA